MSDITNEQEALLKLVLEFVEADAELRKCLSDTPYDAGYFCSRYSDARTAAAVELFKALDGYILQVIERTKP